MKLALNASYEKVSFLPNGGNLYLWTTPNSRADLFHEDITLVQAKQIAKAYGITKLKVQRG
jgi:hypothetical protein